MQSSRFKRFNWVITDDQGEFAAGVIGLVPPFDADSICRQLESVASQDGDFSLRDYIKKQRDATR